MHFSETFLPPNLKPVEKPYIEYFIICPRCHELRRFDYLPGDCGAVTCQKCKTPFRHIPHNGYCQSRGSNGTPWSCGRVLDCLTEGLVTMQVREMWKPYSLIKPRRLTRWD